MIRRLTALTAGILGLTVVAPARAETVVSVTQVRYDLDGRPLCTAVRMNTATYNSLPADACALATTGGYGPDRITYNQYDNVGQVTEVDQAYGTSVQRAYARYTYNPDGTKLYEVDANSNTTQYAYDGFDRLQRIYYPCATSQNCADGNDYEQFQYDSNGNKTVWRRRNGKTLYYNYDNLNREILHYVSDGSVQNVYTDYDLRGDICATAFSTDITNSGPDCTALFTSLTTPGLHSRYDGFGRLLATTDTNGHTLSYAYNQASARTQIVYPDGHYIGATLDAADRMTGMGLDSYANLIGQSYDGLGRRVWLGRGGSVGSSYGYDNFSRLTSMTNDVVVGSANDITWSFTYSPAGQLTVTTPSSTNYDYRETSNVTGNNTYDDLNRDAALVTTTAACPSGGYDANGNLICDGSRLFYYDVYNHLTGIGSAAYPQNGPYLTFAYDPIGRLASQTEYATTTAFLYDGTDLIGEYNGAGNTATMTERYVHGTGTDEPIAWFHGADTSTLRFFFQDYHGSVIGYADASGNLSALYKYSPYGQPEDVSNGNAFSTLPRFGYTGQAVIPEASLYYYKARVYDPIMGRFLQTDPIGMDDDLDLYAYAGDDPIDGADPTGMQDATTEVIVHGCDKQCLCERGDETQCGDASENTKKKPKPTPWMRPDPRDMRRIQQLLFPPAKPLTCEQLVENLVKAEADYAAVEATMDAQNEAATKQVTDSQHAGFTGESPAEPDGWDGVNMALHGRDILKLSDALLAARAAYKKAIDQGQCKNQ